MFHNIVRRVAPLAIAVAALTACTVDSPLVPQRQSFASASTSSQTPSLDRMYRDEATVPFTFVLYAPCANAEQGEVLSASGQLQYQGHWTTSADGQRHHYALVERFIGTAIGGDTGDLYDIATREHSQGNTNDGTDGIQDSGEELQRVQMSLTNRATGVGMDITLVGRFVETGDGRWVFDDWTGKSRCR